MGKLNDLSKDPLFMDASPDVKNQAVKGVVNRAFTEKYGSDALSKINLLPKEEQDAIYGDMANQLNQKVYYGKVTATGKKIQPNNTGDIITSDDVKGLDVFKDKRTYIQADTRSLAQKAFDESILSINATGQAFSSIGDGIVQGLTGYDPNIANALKIGEARDDYGWVQDASATSTGLVAGGLLGVAETIAPWALAPWALPTWYGATQGVMANQENDKARDEALKTGDWQQYKTLTEKKALAVGVNTGAAVATSFIPAHLGGSLAKKALTGAGLGAVQDEINNTTMNYARTGKVELQKPSVGLGTVMGGGFPLAGAGFKKLADKRAKITEAPSQKQAVEALQNEAKNAPLASQRNRARVALGRMNPEYLKQPLQTKAKPASKPFKASLEAPQAVKKPVGIVPIKTKVKPPLKTPDPIVGGLKKKVTPAKVAKPAEVEVPKTETTTAKTTRTDVLKASLEKKEAKLNDLFENQFSHWKKTNGQPMNDKKSGASHFKKSDKNDDAIRNQLAEIEKTKKAIEKEAVKVEQSERVKNSLPSSIVELLDSGKITQWRKFPDTFFVKGVDKGRLQYKNGVLSNRYYKDIPTQEQKAIFKDLYNTLNGKIAQSKTEAPTTKESSVVEPKPQETAVDAPTEVKLKAKVKKDTKGFASELKGAVKNGKISEDEAKNILYNLDEETKQQIVDEIGCHCHE